MEMARKPSSTGPLAAFRVLLLVSCVLVFWTTDVEASAVYDCNSWPGGLLQAAVVVDCADGALGSSFKSVPYEVWRGSKFIVDISRNALTGTLNFSSPSNTIRTISVAQNSL